MCLAGSKRMLIRVTYTGHFFVIAYNKRNIDVNLVINKVIKFKNKI